MSTAADDRATAARLLHQVIARGRTTDQALADTNVSALTHEMVLGSLRHFFSLRALVRSALHRTLKGKDRILESLLIVGVYQLRHLRVPDHAAIFETVEACERLGRPWARGLVNAVLRRCASQPPSAGDSEHPPWLERALSREYADADAIMAADNERAPMTLRINLTRTTPAAYVAHLDGAGISSRPPSFPEAAPALGLGPETRVLLEPRPARSLPGFSEGLVSVQDAGAQFAAILLGSAAGERVLDACAAPGGKLFHLLERSPQARATALERDDDRLARLCVEGRRLGHRNFTAVAADATALDWWNGEPFHRVLLDAPCSGTGTLRRHPDIKVLRQEADLPALAALQLRLLSNLWRVLAPGGTLLYCTCSMLAAENDAVVSRFLADRPDAATRPFELTTGRATRHGWQLLPTQTDTDGFYYARMTRASE